jgi:TatD DNase family protein
MLDVHAHLLPNYFSDQELTDIGQKMELARIQCIVVTEHQEEFEDLLRLSRSCDSVVPFAGLHPIQPHGSIKLEDFKRAESELRSLLNSKCIKGIGEIGLDFSPHVLTGDAELQKREQIEVFKQQLQLAKEFDVFVNVHSRQAGHYAIQVLKEVGNTKVILHAFDGKLKYVKQCASLPWFFSVPGSIQRSEKTKEIALQLPLSQILLESDAPALGPRKNEKASPLDILETLEFIAQLRNIDRKELEIIIDRNNQIVLGSAK